MCGIDIIIERQDDDNSPAGPPHSTTTTSLSKLLRRRGPDAFGEYRIRIPNNETFWQIQFLSTVLYMRGTQCVQQPLVSSRFVLQWNGELYDGIKVINTFIPEFTS